MNNCDMLMRLINDVLAVSALDGSNIRIQPVETDFAKDFNDMCMSLAQRVQTPGVEFIANNPQINSGIISFFQYFIKTLLIAQVHKRCKIYQPRTYQGWIRIP